MDLSKDAPRVAIIGLVAVLAGVGLYHPSVLSDENEFLKSFTSNYFLSVLGLMLSVTLASCTNIHFKLNEIESSQGKNFPNTRKSIKRSAYSLIFLFSIAFLCLLLKSWFGEIEHVQAVMNSIMISILFFYGAVISDITATVFAIPAAPAA